jgi:hypothetical protein
MVKTGFPLHNLSKLVIRAIFLEKLERRKDNNIRHNFIFGSITV